MRNFAILLILVFAIMCQAVNIKSRIPTPQTVKREHMHDDFIATAIGPHHPIIPRRYTPIYIDPMDDEDAWTPNAGFNTTITLDETNYKTSGDANDSAFAISRSSDAGTDLLWIDRDHTSSPLDLTDGTDPGHVLLRYYIPTTQDAANISEVDFYIRSGGNWNNYHYWAISEGSSTIDLDQGWHTITLAPSDGTEVGTVNWAAIDWFRLKVFVNDGSTPTFVLDSIEAIPRLSKAKLAICFDDGHKDTYKLAAFMAAKGIHATFYIIGSWSAADQAMNVSQLHQLQEMGHLIANHSWSHKYFTTNGLTKEQFRDEILKMSVWLHQNGFSKGSRIYAVPGGTAQVDDSVLDFDEDIFPYVDQVRLTDKKYIQMIPNPRYIQCSLANDTDFVGFELHLAEAITDKGIVIFLFHNPNEAAFKAFIDDGASGCVMNAIEAGTLECITMDELLNMRGW